MDKDPDTNTTEKNEVKDKEKEKKGSESPDANQSSESDSESSSSSSSSSSSEQKQKKTRGTKRKRGKKKKKGPKRAAGPYNCFVKVMTPKIREQNPGCKFGEIGKKAAEMWKNLTEEERKVEMIFGRFVLNLAPSEFCETTLRFLFLKRLSCRKKKILIFVLFLFD
jgi:hypothetical protein